MKIGDFLSSTNRSLVWPMENETTETVTPDDVRKRASVGQRFFRATGRTRVLDPEITEQVVLLEANLPPV